MNFSKKKNIAFILFILLIFSLIGGGFSILKKSLSLESQKQEIRDNSGSFLIAILGGYSTIISDFIWIRSYVYWEREDLDKCIADMDLAIAINPHSKMFWTYASSVIAYDSPHWIAKTRGLQNMKQIERIQARKALKYIESALEYFPKDRSLLMDKASIYAQKLGDLKSAIAIYKEICDNEEHLIFTKRAYANLLAQDGQIKEAKKVLVEILSNLEKNTAIYREIYIDLNELNSLN